MNLAILALRGRFGGFRRACACALFAVYLLAVFSLTGVPAVNGMTFDAGINLVPLAGMIGDAKNAALNIALFVPLGLFLPLMWREFRSLPRAALAGLALSLAIEILQLFTFRMTDVNDLITNALGALLGALAARLLLKRFGERERRAMPELALLLGMSFGFAFLAQPLISSAIWGFIYK